MVMTADGAITGPTDEYWPISDDADLRTFRRFRFHVDAVLHGANTLGMNLDRYLWSSEQQECRAQRGRTKPPLFVVVSNSGRIDPSDCVFGRKRYPIAPIVVVPETTTVDPELERVAEVLRVGTDRVDLTAMVELLAGERGVRTLACEGGAIVNHYMIETGLVDEFLITVSPRIIGQPRPRTAVEGPEAFPPEGVRRLDLIGLREVEGEVFLRYRLPDATPLGD
jgi:riboflavin biosynthesis pyrimidine reductase